MNWDENGYGRPQGQGSAESLQNPDKGCRGLDKGLLGQTEGLGGQGPGKCRQKKDPGVLPGECLTEDRLRALRTGSVGTAQRLAALEHISRCRDCAERLAEGYGEDGLLRLPPQFAQGVEKKLSQLRVTATPLSLVRPAAKPWMNREETEGRKRVENAGGTRGRDVGKAGNQKRDPQKEFRRYSCRVALAACVSLALIFSGTFDAGMAAISSSRALNPDLAVVDHITQRIGDFSQRVIYWEVKENDKEKK